MTKDRPGQTNRRRFIDPDAVAAPVFVLADRYTSIDGPWHAHRRLQLVHVSAGVLTVITRRGRFVVPPQRAVWIGPGVEHRISARAPFWLTTGYLAPDLLSVPDPSSVVAIDRLTDEVLIALSRFAPDAPESGPRTRLTAVLLDRLPGLAVADLCLPEPGDARLRRITERLLAHPARGETLGGLAAEAGLTERTAARLFVRETGLTFGQWRQCLRLQVAFEALSAGASVTQAAFDVGYQDVSSFIAAFKTRFGTTPARCIGR